MAKTILTITSSFYADITAKEKFCGTCIYVRYLTSVGDDLFVDFVDVPL